MDRYYVVQTQPQRERLAVAELKNQDFHTFFPILAKAPRVRRGKFEIPPSSPLFPKYLFVKLDLDHDPWRSINGTRGVVRLMSMDEERPSPVPSAAMDRLLIAGEIIQEATAALPFNVHDPVEFVDGPMKGLKALVRLCERDRVSVLLNMLGGSTVVRCAPKDLKYVAMA